jgi:hypothetical protein
MAQLHALAPSICEFPLEAKDQKQAIERFLSLGCGLGLVIHDESLLVVRSIVRDSGKCKLDDLIVEGLERQVNVSNVFERPCDAEISHFPSERLIALGPSHFHQSSPS